jgi:hypothetical protein
VIPVRTILHPKLTKVIGAVATLGVFTSTIIIIAPGKTIIPNDIKKQVTSTVLVPRSSDYSVDKESTKYDKTNKLLSFQIKNNNTTIATLTEQPTPETFTDIPEFGAKFFQQAGEYKTFDSSTGTVHLLHPGKGINDAAAMNAKGTLMFINPKTKFSEDDWRKLFQSISAL